MKLIIFTLFSLFLASAASAQYDSAYTSVADENCNSVTLDKEFDSYNVECPAFGGYQVKVLGGDIRYDLDLSYQGVRIPTYKPGAFHDMGAPVIEWRYTRIGSGFDGAIKYTALIYRLSISAYSENGDMPQDKDSLVVVRLNGASSCVVGIVASGSAMNKKARAIADDMSKKCLASQNIF